MGITRKIAADLPQQAWYMELPPRLKALYIHLILTSDIAGSFEITPRAFSMLIGEEVTEEELFTKFGKRVQRLSDTKGILVDFVPFQYLSSSNPVLGTSKQHRYVAKRLEELGLTLEDLLKRSGHYSPEFDLQQSESAPPKKRDKFVPPTVEEVAAYCKERGNRVNPERFVAYYATNGWTRGRHQVPIQNWKQCVITWEQRDAESAPATPVKTVLRQEGTTQRRFG